MSRSGNKAPTVIERILNGRPDALEHCAHLQVPITPLNLFSHPYSLHFVLEPWLHVGAGGATS